MAKLTSAQRKNLPDSQFGLPEDKAYPMPDEQHVRSAIAYFHSCPREKRKELAGNINRIAKSFHMKIKLHKDSPFKPYADKDIIAAEAVMITESWFPISFEVPVKENDTFDGNINTREALNKAIAKIADRRLEKSYTLGNLEKATCNTDCVISDFVIDSDRKLTYDITRNFFYGNSVDDIMGRIKSTSSLIHNTNDLLGTIDEVIDGVKQNFDALAYMKKVKEVISANGNSPITMGLIDQKLKSVPGTPYSSKYLEKVQVPEFKNFPEELIQWGLKYKRQIKELTDACNEWLKKRGYPTVSMSKVCVLNDIMDRGAMDGFYYSTQDMLYLGYVHGRVYSVVHSAIARDEHNAQILVATLVLVHQIDKPAYAIEWMDKLYRTKKLPRVITKRIICQRHMPESSDTLEQLTEGVHLTKDGDLKFIFNSNKSYMDKYATFHKVMEENRKNGNVEAFKHDLAYMFALIVACENLMNKTDESTDTYKDALKARAFATNDYKRGMKWVMKKDPKFNFHKFYSDNNYDKEIYTIYSDDLAGLKKLIKKLAVY